MHFNVFSSFLKGALHDFEGKHAYIYSLYYSHRFLQQFCEIVNSSNWLLHFNIFNQCFCWRFLRSKLLMNWSTLLGLAGRWLRRQWLCWIPGLVDSMRIVTFHISTFHMSEILVIKLPCRDLTSGKRLMLEQLWIPWPKKLPNCFKDRLAASLFQISNIWNLRTSCTVKG